MGSFTELNDPVVYRGIETFRINLILVIILLILVCGMIIRFEWVLCFIERIFDSLCVCLLVLIRMEKVAEPSVEALNW